MGKKLVLAISGASGAIYAKVLMDKLLKLSDQWESVGVLMSKNAQQIWEDEIGNKSYKQYDFDFYEKLDFSAPFASGSARYGYMIVCPCSMGTMGRIASGTSDDLLCRAADVILKERRRLILVPRDTPHSLIHIENMRTITLAGGIICPASPSFYSHPKNFEELASTVVDRILDLCDFELDSYRWGEDK